MQIISWNDFLKSGLPLGEENKCLNKSEQLSKCAHFCSMTVGVFDGVHRGHQELIKRIVSHNAELVPVVVTFRENHKTVNREQVTENREQRASNREQITDNREQLTENNEQRTENKELYDILSFQQRLDLFERLGIAITIVVDFNDEFRKMKGAEFLKILSEHARVGFFAVGSDFCCGYQLDTDAEAIKKYFASRNIEVEIVPQVMEGSSPVSSSRIRAAIAAGDMELAHKMLLGDICPRRQEDS